MARTCKEPVVVRYKELANGNRSVYLDIHYGDVRKKEYLKLYLLPEVGSKRVAAMAHNANIMKVVNTIKAQRLLDVMQGKTGIAPQRSKKILLVEWIEQFRKIKRQTCRGKMYEQTINTTAWHLVAYCGNGVLMSDIDKTFCEGFLYYLRHTKTKWGKPLSENSMKTYFTMLGTILKRAVLDGVIAKNPIELIDSHDRIGLVESDRVYLTVEELKAMADAECWSEVSKRAFMFACFCGLRISDIMKLTWDDIIETRGDDGEPRYHLSTLMQKTQRKVNFVLSKEAVKWLPKKKDADGLVFPDLPQPANINRHIKNLAKNAGITKDITFHTSRHTFATMMLTFGADLYTTSKLLGHTNIATTQIYAKIIDKKKDEAMGLIDKFFT